MGALAGFRYRDIIKRLKQLGLEFHRQAAGNHPGDMTQGALRAILKQAGINAETFLQKN